MEFKGITVSDELLGTFVPLLVYWIYSGIYMALGSLENYRLHTIKDEDEKNLVSKREVVKGVLLQQAVQAVVATLLFAVSIYNLSEMKNFFNIKFLFVGNEKKDKKGCFQFFFFFSFFYKVC